MKRRKGNFKNMRSRMEVFAHIKENDFWLPGLQDERRGKVIATGRGDSFP
jgi:hypothetical protein